MNFAVIGLGIFGQAVAACLTEKGADVIGIDADADTVESLRGDLGHVLRLDSTDERAMREAGLEEVDIAVVAHGDSLEASILTTAILRRLGVPRIIARSSSDLHAEVLREVGADRVVSVEREQGRNLAASLLHPSQVERVPLGTGQALVEIVPRDEHVGKTLRELDARNRHGINIIAIRHREKKIGEGGDVTFDETVDTSPGPDSKIGEEDRLLAVGEDEALAAFGSGTRRKGGE